MSYHAELADYEWLTGPEAAESMGDLAERSELLHASTARLRRHLSPARTHLVLEQVVLRERAMAKFARAGEMFFTRLGLEQATDQWVAAYKARRFAGRGPVADLCCGIGGDLLALAAYGPTFGVDRDAIATCLADANASAVGRIVSLQTCEIENFDACGLAAWHLDPDRRPTGHRTTSIDWSSPNRDQVDQLLAAVPNAAIKLAPAADAPPEWCDRCELEWISRDRQCRQLVAWHGELAAIFGERRATVLSVDGSVARSIVGVPNLPVPRMHELHAYLFEPDHAVLAAHLTGALAAEYGLSAVSAGVDYLTGPAAIHDPALACFAVEEVLPLDLRHVAAHLRERHIGRLEIKKRGVEHDPDAVRRQLRLVGDEAATLFLTKLGGKHAAILAQRVHHPEAITHATCL